MRLLLLTGQRHHSLLAEELRAKADVFVYDDPLKALDNMSELQADISIVSIHDFPRHWKPLQIIAEQLNSYSRFYLIADAPIHRSESRKIQAMNIAGLIQLDSRYDFSSDPVYQDLLTILNTESNQITTSHPSRQDIATYTSPAILSIPGIVRLLPCQVEISGSDIHFQIDPSLQRNIQKNSLIFLAWAKDGRPMQSRAIVESADRRMLKLL